MRIPIAGSVLCVMVMLAGVVHAAVTVVDPSDPNLLYTGRWDFSNQSQPWCYWIGSSIIAEFEGTGIQVTMGAGESGRSDYFRVIIDDDAANSLKIPVSATVATHTLASGLADTVHKVEIIKETDVGRWAFHSLELDDGRTVVAPSARPPRKIVFYGDSNLAGYSLESEQNEAGDDLRGAYYGYAGILSRMLGAEYQNISRSGATISSLNGVFDRMDYGSAAPIWDFNEFPAEVVVVNVGANDVGRPIHRIKSDYHAFLDDLRAAHPGAYILLYNAWGWDYDEPANFTHEVIAERSDPAMASAVFPWIFEQWHGCEYDHAGMARILADHLTSVFGWSQVPGDVMNGFGTIGNIANGSFEETAPFGGYGWRYYTDTGVSRVHDPMGAFDGEFILHLADGASSHQPLPARDGETVSVALWMRGAEYGDAMDITIDFRDQEMWTTPLQTNTQTFHLTTDWQQYSMTAEHPVGTTNPIYHTRVTLTAGAGDAIDIDDVALTAVSDVRGPGSLPTDSSLCVSPNPFNPRVSVEFRIPRASPVLLTVYDLSGRRVAVLADGFYQRGDFVKKWDGRDDRGRELGSGTYFAYMVAGEFTAMRKMVLLK